MFKKDFFNWSMAALVLMSVLGPALPVSVAVADINEKIAQLDIDTAGLDDVIKIFGEPQKYLWGRETFTKYNLPATYIAAYPNGFNVVMSRGKISELRFEQQGAGYIHQGKLRVGSSLDEVLEVVGQPTETVEGQACGWADGVLYKDIDGRKGYCYYKRGDQNVRFFFGNYKVNALYITAAAFSEGGNSAGQTAGPQTVKQSGAVKSFPKIDRRPKPDVGEPREIKSLPKYDPDSTNPFKIDLMCKDLSKLDLSNSINDLLYATFDDKTVWPATNRMPPRFDWQRIMELGKNPGLGVRSLHKKGITGRGVGIAILDQPLLVDHQEYADRLRLYEEIHIQPGMEPQMHGPAVASIALGKTVGVAPEAELYYIAQWNFDWEKGGTPTLKYLAQAVHRIVEINEQLPKDKKIRVISISKGWTQSHKDYKVITKAVRKAKAKGMLVVCASVEEVHKGFDFVGLGRSPLSDPDIFESYEPGLFLAKHFYEGRFSPTDGCFWVPMDSRTTASPTGNDEYVFYREGGFSWAVPYIAGVYALAVQVDPDITPRRFWTLAIKTGRNIELDNNGKKIPFGPILDPVRLIKAVKRRK